MNFGAAEQRGCPLRQGDVERGKQDNHGGDGKNPGEVKPGAAASAGEVQIEKRDNEREQDEKGSEGLVFHFA